MSYCSIEDVIARVGAVGVINLGDEVGDSDNSSSEESSSSVIVSEENLALVESSIEEAATEIDAALTPWLNDVTTAYGNQWLRYKCIDLAAEILCGRKGQPVPESFADAAERARQKIELVRRGKTSANGIRVPGLVYPGDGDTTTRQVIGTPIVANPLR